jgi:hypothetical protein
MRKAVISLVLAAMGVTLAMIVLDVGLQIALPPDGCRHRAPLWQPDGWLGWSLIPGTSTEAAVCDGNRVLSRSRIDVNALGQRDRPRRFTRRPGVPRIAVLGDSFVEAVQVSLDETFLARVEGAHGVEMLNLGVSGYSTDNELRTWVVRGRRYRPDAVLLFVFPANDVLENGARLYLKNPHGLLPKPWLRAVEPSTALEACLTVHRGAARTAANIPTLLWMSSRITRLVATQGVSAPLQLACAHATGPAVTSGVPEMLGVYGEPRTIAWAEGWRATERAIIRLARRVWASGAAFGVVLVPAGFELDPGENTFLRLYPAVRRQQWDWEYPQRRLRSFLEASNVPVLSLHGPFREHARDAGRIGYYPWDGHWDPEGHGVAARAVVPFVEGLLAGRLLR